MFGSLCAYTIARRKGRLSNVVYILFVVGIILPFQLAIIPLFVAMLHLGLVGNYAGMILLNVGLLMPLTVFLYTGFIRALPRDYEEAARVDGAGILRTYARVVFPLLWPITGTVAVLVGIIVWNEFFVALIFLAGSHYETRAGRPLRLCRRLCRPLEPDLRRGRDRDRTDPRLLPVCAAPPDPRVLGGREGLMAAVTLSGVGKVYPDGTRAVTELDLRIEDGELMVLVGPSGCGKTTTLRMTAGLEEITEGEIRIGDRLVNSLDPRQRDVAMVFQNYALYPHMSVFDNLAFPLRARRLPKTEIRARVERTAKLLGLDGLLKRKPRALSGGQRQRVAMGRAIVREPQVFLMDEPLSNLDANLRTQMRTEIAGLQRQLGVTTMYVTHDQVEAMTMGTRIAVMRGGLLQQQGPPQTLYDEPDNLFVATFIGSPMMNLLQGRIERDGNTLAVRSRRRAAAAGRHERLRPRARRLRRLRMSPSGCVQSTSAIPLEVAPDRPRLRGRVRFVELLGAERLVQIQLDVEPLVAGRGTRRGTGRRRDRGRRNPGASKVTPRRS